MYTHVKVHGTPRPACGLIERPLTCALVRHKPGPSSKLPTLETPDKFSIYFFYSSHLCKLRVVYSSSTRPAIRFSLYFITFEDLEDSDVLPKWTTLMLRAYCLSSPTIRAFQHHKARLGTLDRRRVFWSQRHHDANNRYL